MHRRNRVETLDIQVCKAKSSSKRGMQIAEGCEHEKTVAHARKTKFQKGYWQRQKWCNKQILGKSSKQSLDAVQDPVTHEVHTDPSKLRECVHKYFQNMASPAVGKSKTGALLPTQAPRGDKTVSG